MPKLGPITEFSPVEDGVILLPTQDKHHHLPTGQTPL